MPALLRRATCGRAPGLRPTWTARRLSATVRTPEEVAALEPSAIEGLIQTCTRHEARAPQIRSVAREIAQDHGGALRCDEALLRSFRGVGPECAGLVLGIACGESYVSVAEAHQRLGDGHDLSDLPEALIPLSEVTVSRS